MTTKHDSTANYDDFLDEQLKDKDLAIAYLNECLTNESDLTLFLVALRRVVQAQGIKMTHIAKDSGLSREKLYTMLSDKGNPEMKNIKAILDSLGYKLTIAG
jgi:probable addiction module antidote protein